METHVKAIAILNILSGVLGVLSVVILLVAWGPAVVVSDNMSLGGILTLIWITAELLLAGPSVVIGLGLLRFRPWARTAGTVLSIFNLVNLPIGTTAGVYGLWVLMSQETDPLFSPRFLDVARGPR
ncbi:MAG: hypothetical protein M3O35_18200 [Acidobacteriota bacterium]|nr:hypothetical protein [Acidobacteriota bacterium]